MVTGLLVLPLQVEGSAQCPGVSPPATLGCRCERGSSPRCQCRVTPRREPPSAPTAGGLRRCQGTGSQGPRRLGQPGCRSGRARVRGCFPLCEHNLRASQGTVNKNLYNRFQVLTPTPAASTRNDSGKYFLTRPGRCKVDRSPPALSQPPRPGRGPRARREGDLDLDPRQGPTGTRGGEEDTQRKFEGEGGAQPEREGRCAAREQGDAGQLEAMEAVDLNQVAELQDSPGGEPQDSPP